MDIIWKDIPGYEGLYQVSNLGTIYSVRYKRLRKSSTDRYGYAFVGLNKHGNQQFFSIHRLVASAFIQNPCNLPEVNHIDGNKQNNRADNLEWCDHYANMIHAYKAGLVPYAIRPIQEKKKQRTKRAKLSKEMAQRIRSEHKPGVRGCGCRSLAKKYGVSATTIKHIIGNKAWKE